ncbi:FtsX-like permease family protein [Streptococcus dentasini]
MKRTFWKDIRKSFTGSSGRFISIMTLMFLGAFALIGLKVTAPDMERTASDYLQRHHTMDLSVIASAGFSQTDQRELNRIRGAKVEYGYMTDVSIKGKDDAVQIFSKTDTLSSYKIVSGKLPSKPDQIALSSSLKKDYQLGDKISFTQKSQGILKHTTYKIVGFVNSSEIWSTKNLGTSTAGDGDLAAYAVTTADSFASDVYNLARLRYRDLQSLNPYASDYKKKLKEKQEALDDSLLDNGEQRLAAIKKDKQAALAKSQSQVDQAKSRLEAQERQLVYLSGQQLQAAEAAISQGKTKLAKSQASIQNAKAALKTLPTPSYRSYSRTTLPGSNGYRTYGDISRNIDRIGDIFPVVLYLVAALVTFTTMTRFVNEERNKAGILKALGYFDGDVLKKFVIYGLVAGLLGTLIGVLGGHYLLPYILTQNPAKLTTLGRPHFYFYWSYTVLSLLLALISAVLPAFLVARRELREKPAQLLRPKPPVSGSKILLERISFIWQRLSFTQKVTIRNIFRYKQRMVMTIFGVVGSVALLFAGLGLQSSLGKIVERQFNQLTPYDMLILRNDQANQTEKQQVDDFLNSDKVVDYQAVHTQTIDEKISGQDEKKSITIMSTDQKDFGSFIRLRDPKTNKSLDLDHQGALISKKLAAYYGVKKGDTLTLKDDHGHSRTIKVAGLADMNVGHYIFMSDSYYQNVFGQKATHNGELIKLKDGSQSDISKQSSHLLNLAGVASLTQNSSMITMVKTAVNGLDSSMTILIVVSIVLAIVILYNLTNINVAERIRELSTIKVLGFHSREVMMYIYRETILLSVIGMILGLVSGYYLHRLIITMMSQDTVYPSQVDIHVYLVPLAVIIFILITLGWVVYRRLKTVDMLEALKAVD